MSPTGLLRQKHWHILLILISKVDERYRTKLRDFINKQNVIFTMYCIKKGKLHQQQTIYVQGLSSDQMECGNIEGLGIGWGGKGWG